MKVLAIDIGASSGRFIVVDYSCGSFHMDETFRFDNEMYKKEDDFRWNLTNLENNIKRGLQITFNKYQDILALGIDTWAVDYVLLSDDKVIDDPYGYRALRNNKAAKTLLEKIDYQEIYKHSGIQFLPFNSIFQLYDDIVLKRKKFDSFLLMPDYFSYFLTGEKRCEITNFSTTSLYDPTKREIDRFLCKTISLDESKINRLILPYQKVGEIKKELVDELGIYKCDVIALGSHDTASAIASIKLDEKTMYISSGTWSLLGCELSAPLINEESFKANFTNEIGLEHRIRFLKNIMGLFIIQELKKDFMKDNPKLSFQDIQDLAIKEKDNDIYIDVDDELFQTPSCMLEKFYTYLKRTNQDRGELRIGQIALCVYESMAFKYIAEFKKLENLVGHKFEVAKVIGGGIKIKILNQLIASSLNIRVETGDKEATVMGNALGQFIALGEFSSLDEARLRLSKSTVSEIYYPQEKEKYLQKYESYLKALGGKKDERN